MQAGGRDRTIGRFEVEQDDLKSDFVEVMLMTCMGLYVKLQKKHMQAEKGGHFGGFVSNAMYSVAG